MRLLSLLLLVGCASGPLPQVYRLDFPEATGSGFVISCEPVGDIFRVLVVTAAHVVEDEPGVFLVDDTWLFSETWVTHPEEDIAIIEFLSPIPYMPWRLRYGKLEFGEPVSLDGFPAGRGPLRRAGFAGGGGLVSTSAFPGDSGGPIFDDNGQVVGILVGVLGTNRQLITFVAEMVSIRSVEDWLRKELEWPLPR